MTVYPFPLSFLRPSDPIKPPVQIQISFPIFPKEKKESLGLHQALSLFLEANEASGETIKA